jgi:hypothetical protein
VEIQVPTLLILTLYANLPLHSLLVIQILEGEQLKTQRRKLRLVLVENHLDHALREQLPSGLLILLQLPLLPPVPQAIWFVSYPPHPSCYLPQLMLGKVLLYLEGKSAA